MPTEQQLPGRRSSDRCSDGLAWNDTLGLILSEMAADSGTIHMLGEDGVLHLKAASAGIPQVVLDTIKDVPVGKGMAGLAVERKAARQRVQHPDRHDRRRPPRRARDRAAGIGRRSHAAR